MRIILAGAQSKVHLECLINRGVKNILMSYYYIKNYSKKMQQYILDEAYKFSKNPDSWLMLDSGVFTLYSTGEKDIDRYTKEYTDFVREYPFWDTFVEMDMDMVKGFGPHITDEIRRKYFYPMEEKEYRVTYVMHKRRIMSDWVDMVNRHKYLAIGSTRKFTWLQMRLMLREAYKKRRWVHGLAFTNKQALPTVPYTSVDSTSWLVPTMYGLTHIFSNNQAYSYGGGEKFRRKQWRNTFKQREMDYKGIEEDKWKATMDMGVDYWIRVNDFIDRKLKLTPGGRLSQEIQDEYKEEKRKRLSC